MKSFALESLKIAILTLAMTSVSLAQNGPNLNSVSTDQDTTISIKKGAQAEKSQKTWEIEKGTAEIAGEPELMMKDARKSWKAACDEWKKEFKELNRENKILNISCNTANCEKAGGPTGVEVVCNSKATYTLKVKITD